MRIYDVSVTISPDMPVYPGDPGVGLERVKKIEEGANSNVSHLDLGVHTGTHVDAPYHFLQDGPGVDILPLKMLTGRVYVLHLPEVDLVTASVLKEAEIPLRTKRVLFKTRNSDYWANQENQFQSDYVGISPDGAEYLVDRKIQLIGVDYLSVAPYKNSRPTHEIFLKAGTIIIEGLNLSEVPQGRYTLYCLPLKLKNCDGAPARTILMGV